MNSFKKFIMMANQAPKKQNRVFWNQQARIEEVSYDGCTYTYDGDTNSYTLTPTSTGYFRFYVKIDYVYGEVHKKLTIFDYNINGSGTVRISFRNCTSNGSIAGSGEFNPSLAGTGIKTYLLTTGYIGTTSYYRFSQVGVYGNDTHSVTSMTITNIRCYDLTLMFGAGNEPATVEEFEQRIKGIPVDIYAYNSGEWIEWDTKINPNDYLTFEALNNGVKLLYTRGTSTFQYSADLGKSWQNWLPESYSPILNVGDKLLVKCVNPVINSTSGIGCITSDQERGYNYKVSGDIMSMIYGDDAAIHYSLKGYDRCFNIFLASQRLLDAGDLILKATELAPYCYNQLLYGCNNNIRLPKELPAENLAANCCRYFSNGGPYTEMPIIKATSANSYNFYAFLIGSKNITKIDLSSIKRISGNRPLDAAFKNCSALNYIKIGWKQWANPSSLSQSWVEGVSSQGTFVMPYNIEFDPESIRGTNGIPEGWEVKYYDPDNPDDVRDSKDDFLPTREGKGMEVV